MIYCEDAMLLQRQKHEPHPDDPVRAVTSPNAVETLQETNEAIQQDPVPAVTHSSTCPLPINIPVSLPVGHPPSPSGWKQEEASSPELQGIDQAEEAEAVFEKCEVRAQCVIHIHSTQHGK